ncbi:MAG: HflX-like GTP-binding protein, partial [bacterium]
MTQRALLIGINTPASDKEKSADSLEELTLLSETAGAENTSKVLKNIKKIDSAYYLSKGMLEEI